MILVSVFGSAYFLHKKDNFFQTANTHSNNRLRYPCFILSKKNTAAS